MDLIEVLDELGIQNTTTHHHVTSGWVGIDCPFCSPNSNRFRLGINLEGLYSSCWTCGSLRLWDVLVEIVGDVRLVHKHWKGIKPVRIADSLPKSKGKLILPPNVSKMTELHREYLRSRGFDPDEIHRLWRVEGIGVSLRLKWRLFIPIHFRGEIVSWTTRAVGSGPGQRYISAGKDEESLPHKQILYGLDHVRHTAIICEGPADVWAVGPGAVATFGVKLTQSQINRLARIPNRIVCFDSTEDGRAAARRLCEALEIFEGRTFDVELDAKDPGEASKREIRKLRRCFLGGSA